MRRQAHSISSVDTQCDHHRPGNHVSVVSVVHHSKRSGQLERDDEDDGPMFIRSNKQNFAVPFECRRNGSYVDGAETRWNQSIGVAVTGKSIGEEVYPEYHYIATSQDRIYENLNTVRIERQQESNGYGTIGQPRPGIHHSTLTLGQPNTWNRKKSTLTTNSLTRRGAHSTPRKQSTNSLIEDGHFWDYLQSGKTLSCTGLLDQSTENIYENICDHCCAVFTGPECRKCNSPPVKSPKPSSISSEKVGSIFTGLFSSFRSKSTTQKPRHNHRRPTIVHNVDSVFRTNASFDLNEICRLKASNGKTTRSHQQPIYSQPVSGYGCLNKHFIDVECKHLTAQSVRSTINHTPSTTLHNNIHSTVSPSPLLYDSHCSSANNDVTKSRSAAAIVVWMTSLRWSTEEYECDDEDQHNTLFSIKRIASSATISSVGCCNTFGRSDTSSVEQTSPECYRPSLTTSFTPPAVSSSIPTSELVTVRHKFNSPSSFSNNHENDDRRRWAVTTFRENSVAAKRQAIYVRSTRDKTKSAIVESSSSSSSSALSYARGKPVIVNYDSDLNKQQSPNTVPTTKDLAKEIGFVCCDLITFTDPIVPKKVNPHQILVSNNIINRVTVQRRASKRDRLTHIFLSICLNRTLIISAVDQNRIRQFLSQCKYLQQQNAVCVNIAQQFYDELQSFVIANTLCIMSNEVDLVSESVVNSSAMTNSTEVDLPKPTPRARTVPPIVQRVQKPIVVTRPAPPIPAPRRKHQDVEEFLRHEKQPSTPVNRHVSRRIARSRSTLEDTYQSIWQFTTVGQADDTVHHPVMGDDISNDDDSDYDDSDIPPQQQHSDIDNHNDDDSLSDGPSSWELAEEFQFSLVPTSSPPPPPFDDPYQRICILIGVTSSKHTQLLYDLTQPLFQLNPVDDHHSHHHHHHHHHHHLPRLSESDESTTDFVGNNYAASDKLQIVDAPDANNNLATAPSAASVNAWRTMLRGVDYAEDEEDVNLHGSFQPNRAPLAKYEDSDDESNKLNSSQTETKTLEYYFDPPHHNEPSEIEAHYVAKPTTPPIDIKGSSKSLQGGTPSKMRSMKDSIKGILQSEHYNISSGSGSYTSQQGGVASKLARFHVPRSKSSIDLRQANATGHRVFGAPLHEIESNYNRVPLFVIECVRFIERPENLETTGIYRASGKKDSIDKLIKRMNEKNNKKTSKYKLIELEDVHTITSALKQFFRELKTELIPTSVVDKLPINLDSAKSLPAMRSTIENLNQNTRETLKFLLRHLIKVDSQSAKNKMTASNLSIVWGACIFPSSAITLDTSELMRKNMLFRVLLLRYKDIFERRPTPLVESSEC